MSGGGSAGAGWRQRLVDRPAFPYLAPLLIWLAFLLAALVHPHAIYLFYPIQVFAAGVVLVFQLPRLPPLSPVRPWTSAAVGLFTAAAWIALLPLFPVPLHPPFDPQRLFGPGQIAGGLMAFRVLGEGIVYPAAVAVFVYGFVMRFFIRVRFQTIALGEFSIRSLITAVLVLVACDPGHGPGTLEMALVLTVWFLFTRSLGSALLATVTAHLAIAAHLIGVGRITLL